MTTDIPNYLMNCIRKDKKGLTQKGVNLLIDEREAIDFDDCFGVSDCIQLMVLERFVTESQDKRIWNKLREKYGDRKVRDVLMSRYGEVVA
ncbi:MAG: hypothetical protein JRN15_10600 [Nitrososphaerota archaeon]|nr:hypothetical protein [Nitrososphaerota archaeon]